jgi:hypothetical protein
MHSAELFYAVGVAPTDVIIGATNDQIVNPMMIPAATSTKKMM